MNNFFKFSYFLFLSLFISELFFSCATIEAPKGGPKDSIPPIILNFEPINNTINYKKAIINLEFSKFMNKSKVIENIFISPTVPMKYNWSKKSLEIVFTKELQENTTYSFQLGTEYTDFLGNKPEKAFNIIFSSGSSLDSGTIGGKLFSEKTQGIYIFAYRIDNINSDTLNPSKTKAHYRTQVGTSGEFEFKGLKKGKYRIFAVDDKFKDELIDFNSDLVSSASKDYEINTKKEELNLRIGNPIDNIPPSITNAICLNQKKIILTFNEDIDTLSINKNAFELKDSSGIKSNEILSVYFKDKSSKEIVLITKDTMAQKDKWKVTAKPNIAYPIQDLSKNKILDTNNSSYFFGSDDKDTNKLILVNFDIKDSTKDIETDRIFQFNFNQAVDSVDISKRIKLSTIDDKEVPYLFSKILDNSYKIILNKPLISRSWYKLKIDMNKFKSIEGNQTKDTTFLFRFSTKVKSEGLSVSGKIIDSSGYNGAYRLELTSNDGKTKYFVNTNTDKNVWKFENVITGTYKLSGYYDENKNSQYDYGTFYPFKPSEKFFNMEKEIKVNTGWSIEDIILKIGK